MIANAQITVEIELDLTGYIDPAESMTRDYPGCDALVQDIDVDYAYILPLVFVWFRPIITTIILTFTTKLFSGLRTKFASLTDIGTSSMYSSTTSSDSSMGPPSVTLVIFSLKPSFIIFL